MSNKDAIALLDKYLAGECTPEERVLVERAYNKEVPLEGVDISSERYAEMKVEIWSRLEETNPSIGKAEEAPAKKPYRLWPRIAAAAAVLLVIGLGLLFYKRYVSTLRHPDAGQDLGLAGQFKPGSNKAYLTLGNGKRIALNDAANGTIAQQAGVQVTKTADGQLVYRSGGRHSATEMNSAQAVGPNLGIVQFNTVETPRGGQYQVVLPDGTKVWLNASSSLKYPASFAAAKFRKIEMTGEAYFEVAKDKKHPFIVKTPEQEVEVLGTHFNINSYTDEPSIKTTLLEGSVRVRSFASFASNISGRHPDAGQDPGSAILAPGEQSSLTKSGITVSAADVQGAVAWKNNLFWFKNADIKTVMRQMSRWYDVDVEYEGQIPTTLFTGKIYKNANAAQVLKLLNFYQVKYRIEGGKIIVTNHF